MRVLCRHGHFAFYQAYSGEVAEFTNYFGLTLERDGEFYTFPLLAGAPDYSLAGKAYLGLAAVKTFEGIPWEVLKENGFVYNIATGKIVPKLSIIAQTSPVLSGYYFISDSKLIQPGSRDKLGNQILSYDAEFVFEYQQLRVTEFSYG